MEKSIDQFLDRVPSKNYNCLNFVQEVWMYLCGEDMKGKLAKLATNISGGGLLSSSAVKGFIRLNEPVNPCFVVMQRFRLTPHVGIYLNGRILHLRAHGVEFQPLVVAKGYFTIIRYYR